MEIVILIDTNIFLEILLEQEKKENCKQFLKENSKHLFLSDFSLNSIGVILFRNKKEGIFANFIRDILPNIELLTINKFDYNILIETKLNFGLDFDDSYQYTLVLKNDMQLVTMDKDFIKVRNQNNIIFI